MKPVIISFILFFFNAAWALPEFVDSPSQCFSKKSYPCSIRVTGSYLSFERDAQKYHLADQGVLLFLDASEIQLLRGALWVRDSNHLRIKVSPVLRLETSGELFMERQSANLQVRNLSGTVKFHSDKVFPSETLPVGFQNWYGPVDSYGQVTRGMIRPIHLSDFLKAWIPVSGVSIAEIRKLSLDYKESWKEALELSTQIYQQVVERRIASQEEKALKLEKRRQDQLKEQSDIRKMYRQKNSLENI